MAVDEQIQRAWTRLTGKTCDHPGHVLFPGDRRCAGQPPDPATQPWEWVKAFWQASYGIEIDPDDKSVFIEKVPQRDGEWWEANGDTPEAALEAAIREWEASHVIP